MSSLAVGSRRMKGKLQCIPRLNPHDIRVKACTARKASLGCFATAGSAAIEGVITPRGIPLTLCEPIWKRHLRLNASKEVCRARAIQLLPSAANELQRI